MNLNLIWWRRRRRRDATSPRWRLHDHMRVHASREGAAAVSRQSLFHRLEELGLSPPKPKVRKKSKSLWRRVFGSRKVILDRPLKDEPQCPTQRRLRDKVRTKGLAPLPPMTNLIKDDFSTNANHIVLKPKKKKFEPGKPLDIGAAICYDSDESSEGDLFDDLEVLGEEG